jgi:hypothetical protein
LGDDGIGSDEDEDEDGDADAEPKYRKGSGCESAPKVAKPLSLHPPWHDCS